jgi:hypothetical protein
VLIGINRINRTPFKRSIYNDLDQAFAGNNSNSTNKANRNVPELDRLIKPGGCLWTGCCSPKWPSAVKRC